MKFHVIRSIAFGFVCSAAVGVTSAGLAQLSSLPYVPGLLAWPFLLFIAGGYPLGRLLEMLPGYEQLQWAVFSDGGAGPAFATVLAAAFITWAFVFAIGRLSVRKHRPGPNNSFKPKPLRGSA